MTRAPSEPSRTTEPDLIAIRDELASREPIFHRPELGATRADFERMTAAGFWKKLATIDGKAQLLGEYEVFHGDWHKLFDAPAQFDQVTRAQIQAVAREVLNKHRRTVGVLVPDEEEVA